MESSAIAAAAASAIATASLAPAAPAIHRASHSPVPSTQAVPLKSSLKHSHTHHDPAAASASSSSTLLNVPPSATATSPPASAASAQFTDYGFVQRVSFDATLEAASRSGGGVGSELALTLIASTPGFKRSSESRTFLVACDLNAYSLNALQWTMRALVENGDEVVVLRVFPQSAAPAPSSSAMAPSNSNPGNINGVNEEDDSPLGVSSITETAKDEAHALIASVMEQNSQAVPQRDISVTVEFVVGKVFATIHAMIAVYRPDSLIVGTKGKSDSLFNAFMGSVSKWAVANATIPTIVVRTPDRIRKTKVKRAQRQSYKGLVGERKAAGATVTAAEEKKQQEMEVSSTGTNDSRHDHSDDQKIVREDVEEEGNETEPAPRK